MFTLCVGLLFVSCQSKEEQFLDDYESYVEKLEAVDDPIHDWMPVVNEFLKESKAKYGYTGSFEGDPFIEKFSPKQKERLMKLKKRQNNAWMSHFQ